MKAGKCIMWKCSACQNENKDEYRFCLSCGNPKPSGTGKQKAAAVPKPKAAKSESAKKGKVSAMTILLLVLSLLLIVAIAAIIIVFPKLSGRSSVDDGEQQESSQRHSSGKSSADSSDWGGTSSYIIGGDTDPSAPTVPAPSESAAPGETPPAASPLPIETPAPTPSPTPAPVSEYLLPESNSRYLTEADLSKLTWEQCCLARNEIFARHGRQFLTTEIANYFNSKSWYHGTIAPANFSESVLNEYERANVNFISQYESAHWGGSYY